MPAMAEGPQLAGVVEIGGVFAATSASASSYDDYYARTETVKERTGSFNARLGVELQPNVTAQLDVWASHWTADYQGTGREGADTYEYGGVETDWRIAGAAHLTWRADNGFYAGPVVALGGRGYGKLGSVGIDLGYFGDTWSLYGQIGATTALSGEEAEWRAREVFAGLVGTYYLNDDFSIAANASFSRFNYGDAADDHVEDIARWGIGLNYRPEGLPVVLSVGYRGTHVTVAESWWGSEVTKHGVQASIRVPLGVAADASLREQDRATGLGFMSPYYGR